MTHLFEHYRFTGDKKFLRDTALPIMEGIVEFFNCFLIERDGYLVTAPSLSPETSYITPDGIQEAISIGPTSDNQVCRSLRISQSSGIPKLYGLMKIPDSHRAL